MRLLSYNVNGIRAAIKNGIVEWLAGREFDILCFQEVKAQPEQVDLSGFEALGYKVAGWHAAEKKGYSGVAILSRIAPDRVVDGCGLSVYDCEGRILRADFGEITVLNCYFPSGTSGEVRQGVKMRFLQDFKEYVQVLRRERPHLIICGDYNIAHTENDIHDPIRNKNTTGFLPEERAWLTGWFADGFTDAFRHLNPALTEYSWWSYRAGARANNKGWRIDYHSVSDSLRDSLMYCRHTTDAIHSDHCGVALEIRRGEEGAVRRYGKE